MLVFVFRLCENKSMQKKPIYKLSAYVRAQRGRGKSLAAFLGISDAYLSQMLSGYRPVPPELCPRIEQFSEGEVTRAECRPFDGHLIWPELAAANESSQLHSQIQPQPVRKETSCA